MKSVSRYVLAAVAALMFVGSVSAETIHPRHAYDDDWEERVLRFTPEWHQDDIGS